MTAYLSAQGRLVVGAAGRGRADDLGLAGVRPDGGRGREAVAVRCLLPTGEADVILDSKTRASVRLQLPAGAFGSAGALYRSRRP
jgi:hypothetical protein